MSAFNPAEPCYFAGNDYRRPATSGALAIQDPANLEVVGQVARVSAEEVEGVAAQARSAQRAWARLDAKSRAAALHRLADTIEQSDFHDVAVLMVREMGKPYPEGAGS